MRWPTPGPTPASAPPPSLCNAACCRTKPLLSKVWISPGVTNLGRPVLKLVATGSTSSCCLRAGPRWSSVMSWAGASRPRPSWGRSVPPSAPSPLSTCPRPTSSPTSTTSSRTSAAAPIKRSSAVSMRFSSLLPALSALPTRAIWIPSSPVRTERSAASKATAIRSSASGWGNRRTPKHGTCSQPKPHLRSSPTAWSSPPPSASTKAVDESSSCSAPSIVTPNRNRRMISAGPPTGCSASSTGAKATTMTSRCYSSVPPPPPPPPPPRSPRVPRQPRPRAKPS